MKVAFIQTLSCQQRFYMLHKKRLLCFKHFSKGPLLISGSARLNQIKTTTEDQTVAQTGDGTSRYGVLSRSDSRYLKTSKKSFFLNFDTNRIEEAQNESQSSSLLSNNQIHHQDSENSLNAQDTSKKVPKGLNFFFLGNLGFNFNPADKTMLVYENASQDVIFSSNLDFKIIRKDKLVSSFLKRFNRQKSIKKGKKGKNGSRETRRDTERSFRDSKYIFPQPYASEAPKRVEQTPLLTWEGSLQNRSKMLKKVFKSNYRILVLDFIAVKNYVVVVSTSKISLVDLKKGQHFSVNLKIFGAKELKIAYQKLSLSISKSGNRGRRSTIKVTNPSNLLAQDLEKIEEEPNLQASSNYTLYQSKSELRFVVYSPQALQIVSYRKMKGKWFLDTLDFISVMQDANIMELKFYDNNLLIVQRNGVISFKKLPHFGEQKRFNFVAQDLTCSLISGELDFYVGTRKGNIYNIRLKNLLTLRKEKNQIFIFHKNSVKQIVVRKNREVSLAVYMVSVDEENLIAVWNCSKCILGPFYYIRYKVDILRIVSTLACVYLSIYTLFPLVVAKIG